jgi:hypothetical protein
VIGELDAGNPHVQFDEGRQETCVRAARLSPTLRSLEIEVLLPVGDGDEAFCCRASAIEGTLFLLSNEALDWSKPGALVRLQGSAIVAVG